MIVIKNDNYKNDDNINLSNGNNGNKRIQTNKNSNIIIIVKKYTGVKNEQIS